MSFDAATSEWCMGLVSGASLYGASKEVLHSPAILGSFVSRHQLSHATLPPSFLASLEIAHWKSVGTLIVAGEACSLEQAERWSEGRAFFNAYGPSEATVCASVYRKPAGALSSGLPIGKPISNTELYVLDRYVRQLPIGIPGELHIGGAGLAREYLNRPELTAERFIQNPLSGDPSERLYKTGDLVKYLPDGNLVFLGRIDMQVKLRGFRIELGEVEDVLSRYEMVQDAVVTLHENSHLVGYVSVGDIDNLPGDFTDHLLSHAKKHLPDYMVTSFLVPLEVLPLTPNGKVDRKALPSPDVSALQQEYVAPVTATEQQLAGIWEELLGVDKIGIHDNFFHVGGHSLLAMRLVGLLKNKGITIPIHALFNQPKLKDLAAKIDQAKQINVLGETIVKMNAEERGKPLFLLHEISGDAFQYKELVNYLQVEVPIYGIDAASLAITSDTLQSTEELATQYIEEIRNIQPHGPYRVLGWSFGGQLAFEIAKQLQGVDEPIEFVGLIDTHLSTQVLKNDHEKTIQTVIKEFLKDIDYTGAFRVENRIEKLLAAFNIDEKGVVSWKNDAIISKDILLFFRKMNAYGYHEKELFRRLNLSIKLSNFSGSYFLQKFHLPVYYYSADYRDNMKDETSNQKKIAAVKSKLGDETPVVLIKGSNHKSIVKEAKYAEILGTEISNVLHELDAGRPDTTKRNGFSHSSLVSIQKGQAENAPLYCIPGAGGSIGGLLRLTAYFDNTMPIFGVVPRGLEDDSVPHTTVEAAANYYVNALCDPKKHQSYCLMGHSYGGWVAIELAHRLVALGQTVESVILLDVAPPSKRLEKNQSHSRLSALARLIELLEMQAAKSFNLCADEMITWPETRQMETLLQKMKETKLMPETTGLEDIRRMVHLFIINANTSYSPSNMYKGKVLLVQAVDNQDISTLDQNKQDWGKYLLNFDKIVAKGDHMSMMEQPNVVDLAVRIQHFLSREGTEKEFTE